MPLPVRLQLGRKGDSALIDADQIEAQHTIEFADGAVWQGRVCDRKWFPMHKPHTTYAKCCWLVGGVQRELRLHRLLMDAKAGQLVDHIDRNGLNNTCRNLRIATHAVNSINRGPSGDCKFKGVGFSRSTNKWEAYIRVDGIKKHLGVFITPEDAAVAYNKAAAKYHGRIAYLNTV